MTKAILNCGANVLWITICLPFGPKIMKFFRTAVFTAVLFFWQRRQNQVECAQGTAKRAVPCFSSFFFESFN